MPHHHLRETPNQSWGGGKELLNATISSLAIIYFVSFSSPTTTNSISRTNHAKSLAIACSCTAKSGWTKSKSSQITRKIIFISQAAGFHVHKQEDKPYHREKVTRNEWKCNNLEATRKFISHLSRFYKFDPTQICSFLRDQRTLCNLFKTKGKGGSQ